jgi:hypothetical protein
VKQRKTPHVFDLYKNHQGGTLLEGRIETGEIGEGERKVPAVQESVASSNPVSMQLMRIIMKKDERSRLAVCPFLLSGGFFQFYGHHSNTMHKIR